MRHEMTKIRLKHETWLERASPEIKSLGTIFKDLKSIHERYINAEAGTQDILYEHTERPHVGLLAAAAWRCGETALEEYGCRKGTKHKNKHGRCDLYIEDAHGEDL